MRVGSWSTVFLLVFTLVAPRRALCLIKPATSRHVPLDNSDLSTKIQVWNNVIPLETCSALHERAKQLGLNHRVFSRPLNTKMGSNVNSLVERSLDSILTELNDDSKYVEYWTRQEWRSIHAHADVDEYLAKRHPGQPFRYPIHGHVLYLQKGKQVKGPTCVFPDRVSGGDLVSKDSESPFIELVTVPAVPGRLLRFHGKYIHAVPRPTDLWLLKFVQGSPDFSPEEIWGRSVILFNTWGSDPPLEVPVDELTVSNESNNMHTHQIAPCNELSQWEYAFSFPSSESKEGLDNQLPLLEGEDAEPEVLSAKIWLLGDYRRRDHQLQTVKLKATTQLRTALEEETDVSSVLLQP